MVHCCPSVKPGRCNCSVLSMRLMPNAGQGCDKVYFKTTSNTSAESCWHELIALWQHARACKDLKLQHQAQYDPCLRWVQASSVRQHLYELHIMDFLIHAISLEAELQLSTAVPLSSTATSADTSKRWSLCCTICTGCQVITLVTYDTD